MAMDFDAKVVQVLEPVTGTSARGEWRRQEVIVETPGATFSRKICVTFWGDKVDESSGLKEGDELNLGIDIESREYNGRWYTEVKAWRITHKGPAAQAVPEGAGLPPFSEPEEDPFETTASDDLPF